ncbi:hypothetical protein DIPPA_28446, partial [Diplonema papillatum]
VSPRNLSHHRIPGSVYSLLLNQGLHRRKSLPQTSNLVLLSLLRFPHERLCRLRLVDRRLHHAAVLPLGVRHLDRFLGSVVGLYRVK